MFYRELVEFFWFSLLIPHGGKFFSIEKFIGRSDNKNNFHSRPDYCLGIMGLDNMQDAMNPNNWWHNNDGCVFYRNDNQNVFCTGHAAFTTSPGVTLTKKKNVHW